jgi:ATP-binding cassette subfamily C protein CydCD
VATYLLVSAGAAGFAAWVLPAAGLVTLCMLAAGGVAAYGVSTAGVARAERAFVVARGRLSSLVVQTLQGAPELIAWQATGRALDDIDVASRAAAGASTRSALAVATGRALAVLAAGAGMVAMGWAGAAGLAAHAVSRPMVALLVLLPVALLEVVSPLADAGALRVRTRAADARLATLSRTQPAVADPPRPVALDPVDGTVRLDHVSAGWGAADVVRGVSLGLGPGRRLGMVGPSGCGKSTLAAVLLRFLDPTSGQVRLGARDARDLLLDDVRRTVGLVDDDPHVFSSTLRENVRLARPEASEADLEGALRTARLGSWLDGLPEGMDTLLGDGNAHVSGGERARIGLARAVLAGQPVLVLDEPTAHLDTATANAVADDLLAAGGGRAVLWITHRTVGLDRMDAVLDLGTSYEPGVVRPR